MCNLFFEYIITIILFLFMCDLFFEYIVCNCVRTGLGVPKASLMRALSSVQWKPWHHRPSNDSSWRGHKKREGPWVVRDEGANERRFKVEEGAGDTCRKREELGPSIPGSVQ